MRVGVNARVLHASVLRGWSRYTRNLVAGLVALDLEVFLYTDRELHETHLPTIGSAVRRVRVAPPMRYLRWQEAWLPAQCRRDRVDVLHCPVNFGLPWRRPCHKILTLHDAIFADSWRREGGGSARSRLYHWTARTRADRIVTPSAFARGRLTDALGVDPDRIVVVPEAAEPAFHRPVADADRRAARAAFGLERPYLFYVGGWEARKNVPFLIEAFADAGLPDTDLVLAGGSDLERTAVEDQARRSGVSRSVKLLGFVPDPRLPALYAEALCFVYPSRDEGFGLQLCEAMAVGCPVLAARAGSLPEVLGRGGDTFSPSERSELSNLLRRVDRSPDYRAALARRAKERGAAFSWRATAERTLDVYRQAMEDR